MRFCQSGVWVSNTACSQFYGDLNAYEGNPGTSTCLNGVMANAPTADWYFVEVKRHVNAGNYYQVQTAHAMTGGNVGTIYERVQESGSPGIGWGAWVKQGGASGGGGTWQTSTYTGACWVVNTRTGGCSCPAGYNTKWIGVITGCTTTYCNTYICE